MSKTRIPLVLLLLVLGAAAAPAQTLTVRLVEATQGDGGTDRNLADVSGLLRANTPYNTFRLLSRGSLSLPGSSTVNLGGGYALSGSGSAEGLALTVMQGRKALLKTTVSLAAKKPLVLGGFPSAAGKIILVLVLQ